MVVLTSGLLWKISIFVLFCVLSRSKADESSKCHSNKSPCVVRHLGELVQENYGRPGLSHIFVAGANDDGMKEIEVWMATYAPGSGTPIHRHNCEEVFIVLMGGGTLFLAPASNASFPGRPQMFSIYPNSTFIVPVNSVHQVRNTMGLEDLQVVIVISRPPMKAYVYKDWTTTHDEAVYHFPYFEKKLPATSYPISETDSAIPISSRMDDLQELVIDVDQTYSDELR
ncbi:unnamed protein product [Sphagnum jensenii]|uniref:Auxin-binding protein 1 n=1 Tax=Sphagnum jensenii TaxID=128206 RepID=A0ABP1B3X4_9BRYO